MKKFLVVLAMLFIYMNGNAQGVLKGIVKDIQNDQPIPGASINIGSTKEGTVSDDNGAFTLNYTGSIKTLRVKAIGYSTKDVTITDTGKDIVVALDATNLSTGEIQVEGLMNNKKNLETPGSIGLLSKEDLSRDNGITIQNTMNLLPGVKMEFRTLGSGVLLVMRGYGRMTNFNGNGYKAYYNDISLTDADGSTVLDEVDYTNLNSVEIFKGPTSSIYGTGIGGVISMKTAKAPWGTTVNVGGFSGSYGLLRTNTGISVGNEKLSMFANYGHQQYDGFRDHSGSKGDFGIINGSVYLDSKSTLSFFGNYTYNNNYLPGELDSASFVTDPTVADSNYVKNDAHIKSESSRLGVSYERQFTKLFMNKTSINAGFFYNDQPSAAGLTRTNRSKIGFRTAFIFSPMLGKMKSNFTVGGELLKNINFAKSYTLTAGVLGSLRGDQEVRPVMYNAFLQADINLTKSTLFTAGASINFLEYSVQDLIAQSSTHVNASGYKRFDPVITPRVAINQIINDNFSLYASFNTGYAPPSTSQILITQLGRVNYDLLPENAMSFEFGSKGSLLKKALNYELAIYQMSVKDKLVTQNFAAANGNPAYSITTNAGEVRFRGLEAAVYYVYVPQKSKVISMIRPFATFTHTDDENIDFKSDNNNNANTKDYTGLKVPGVAPNTINAGLDIETVPGIYLNTTYSYVDQIPLSFDNSHIADSYGLLNAKIGFRRLLGKKFNLDVFAGADNLTGQRYSTELFLNVNDLRFYIASPNKPTFYGGLRFGYAIN